MKACPKCGEEWPSTTRVCICGTSLDTAEGTDLADRAERPDRSDGEGRSRPSTMQVVIGVILVLALVPSVVILARTLPSGGGAPSAVDVPDNAPEAQPDQLPDRRERPSIVCSGQDVPDDCTVWTFTVPGNAFTNYNLDVTETAVAVRTREDAWLLDSTTGEQRWHRAESAGPTAALSVWLAADMVVLEAPDGFRTLDATTGEPAATVTLDGEIIWTGTDGQRMVTVTRDDHVTVQGWDPASGDLLWRTHVDVPWTSAGVNVEGPFSERLTVDVVRAATEDFELEQTTVNTSTGDAIDDPDPDANPWDSPAFRVHADARVDGTRLWAGPHPDATDAQPGAVDWERDLDEPFHGLWPVSRDHVGLVLANNHWQIIDARTGDHIGHVQVTNGTIQERSIGRPWPGAQVLMVRVQTFDAAHLVLINMPLD